MLVRLLVTADALQVIHDSCLLRVLCAVGDDFYCAPLGYRILWM